MRPTRYCVISKMPMAEIVVGQSFPRERWIWICYFMMICYWMPDEGLGSSLNLFFDKSVDDNLYIGSVFTLGVGLAQMFAKLALRHGFPEVMIANRS